VSAGVHAGIISEVDVGGDAGDSKVVSGVNVSGGSVGNGREVLAVAVQLVDVAVTQEGSAIVPTRRQNKMYLLIFENLKRLTAGVILLRGTGGRAWIRFESSINPKPEKGL